MLSTPTRLLTVLALCSPLAALAGVKVTVTRADTAARPAQTVLVPYAEVKKQIPDLLLEHVAVRDAAGALVPSQVTNYNPEQRPAAYDEILFQVAFAAGQQSATFTIDNDPNPVPPAPSKVFARYIPERLDDFAFENDRLAHRIYGPGLASPATGKSELVSSGIDVWLKRVNYLIVDRWYTKGHDAYHVDSGEGMDLYGVNNSRGCGGTGIWNNNHLYVSSNWSSWKVIANGPVRAIFELNYSTWDAGGVYVAETKRFTIDAGSNFHRVESTFRYNSKGNTPLTVAVGIGKHAAVVSAELTKSPDNSYLSLWELYRKDGQLGTSVILDPQSPRKGVAEDTLNHLLLTEAHSGKPLAYYIGAGWDRSGQFADRAAWETYVRDFAARLAAPLTVTVSKE